MLTAKTTAADSEAPRNKSEEASCGGGDVLIAVKEEEGEGNGEGSRADVAKDEAEDVEKVCRICHLSPDLSLGEEEEEGSELIQIGCSCKNELGNAHRHCAETWFRFKGNRCCEICGCNAKNITGKEDGSFIEEWHDNRAAMSSSSGGDHRNSSARERVNCWKGQPFCNFLLACLVIAFILPWFFRVNMF